VEEKTMHAAVMSGTLAGTGSFRCQECGYVVSLAAADALPPCPSCGGERFERASLFTSTFEARPKTQPGPERAGWLSEAHEQLTGPGQYIAYEDGEKVVVVPLKREWTRIGRSLVADVRFDDPTVSRRHALIVRQPDGVRVLDDRSLNGVWVNNRRVEWSQLHDGDDIVVGRHRLRFIEYPGGATRSITGATSSAEPSS
jgi:hypothetical protein